MISRLNSLPSNNSHATNSKDALATVKRKSLVDIAGWFSRTSKVLVFLEDATGVSAVVASQVSGGRMALSELVRTTETDFSLALDALFLQLSTQVGKLPDSAVVVSAASVIGLIELPVDPIKPKPATQMLEMMRYELEPAIAAHNGLWTIGAILQARGALSLHDLADIGLMLSNTHSNLSNGALRFGELAIKQGLANQHDIDVALSVQQFIRILDNEIACGWRGYLARDTNGYDAPYWLAAGLDFSHRERWLTALDARNINCLGFAPSVGLAGAHAAIAAHSSQERVALVLEIWPEQVIRLMFTEGKLTGLMTEPRLEQPITSDLLLAQLAEWTMEPINHLSLLIGDEVADIETLVLDLQTLLRCKVTVVADSLAMVHQALSQAAALDALTGNYTLTIIPSKDPQLPIWKRSGVKRWLMIMSVFFLVFSWEAYSWWRVRVMEKERAVLVGRLESDSNSASHTQSLVRDAKELDLKANLLRDELAIKLARADMMALLIKRVDEMPALIRALGRAISPEVVLESVRESNESDTHIGVQVKAWSPDNDKAQAYANTVQLLVADIGLSVAQTDLRRRAGRDGASAGYEVDFWLVPAPEEIEVGSNSGVAAKPDPNAKRAENLK